MPLYSRGKERLSAKWRRSKRNPRWFNIFKAFSSARNKRIPQEHNANDSKIKKRLYTNRSSGPKTYSERKMKEPQPLLDVLEEKNEIIVVAEFAGFNRESLKISVENQRLTLCAESLDRKYYKSLNLPKRVIPSTIRTTYKNGVLEIQLKKVIQEKTIDEVAG
jgi:HSP20 family molecular chaperone IbpA